MRTKLLLSNTRTLEITQQKKKKRTKRRRNVVTKIQQPNVQYEAETKMTKECEKIGERTGQTNGSQQAARNGEERWRPPP